MASADLRDELTCSVCLSIYTDPVTLICGHSFCRLCIADVLDAQDGSGVYTCPECRAKFRERPALEKNRKLRNIAERFQSAHPEEEEVVIFCAYCIQSPVPAIKTCLLCEASLCENHLRVHSKSAVHVLTQPTTSLANRKCSVHKKVLEYYCCVDAACICVSCSLAGEHRGHQVDTLNEASEKKKQGLRNILQKMSSERQEDEKRVQSLHKLKRKVREEATSVSERVTELVKNIREQLDALEKRVLSEISRQEKQVSLRVSDLIQQLEIEKKDLSRKMGHIEELCNMTDPLTVLRGRESDRADCCNKYKYKDHTVGDLDMGLISVTLHAGLTDIVMTARSPSNTVQTSDLLLDVDTANNYLTLTSDLKSVRESRENKRRRNRPERFADHFPSVLSTRSFSSGRHYWEVEVSESSDWEVAMAYPSIDRKIKNGRIVQSWGVGRFKDIAITNDCEIFFLSDNISCRRLGIYLDYEVGRLSFYNLREPISHLHTFTATFTEPLLFLFTVCGRGWVRLGSLDY